MGQKFVESKGRCDLRMFTDLSFPKQSSELMLSHLSNLERIEFIQLILFSAMETFGTKKQSDSCKSSMFLKPIFINIVQGMGDSPRKK